MPFSPQRKRRLLRTCGILAVIVALIIGFVVKCSGSSDSSDDKTETKQIGQGVSAAAKELPQGIKVTRHSNQTKPYELGQGLSSVLSVTPSGKLKAPVTLTIPLNKRVDKSARVFVAANFSHKAGDWHVLQSRLSTGGQHVSVTTSHFSWFWVFTLDSAATSKAFQQDVTDALSGEIRAQANKPQCKDETKARADGYQIASSAKDTLYWCFGMEDGKRVLKVVNRQRYPLNVQHKGLKVLSAGHIQAEVTQLARWGSGNITILYPRDEAVMQLSDLPEGGKATVSTEFSGWAEALYNIDVAFESTVSIMTKFGFKDIGIHTSKYWEYLDKMLSTKSCANAAADRNLGKMVAACFRNFLSDPYGKIGSAILFSVLDAILLVGNWFTSQLQSTYDNIRNYDEYSIVVSRITAFSMPPKYRGSFSYAPSSYVEIANDGTTVLKQYEDGSNEHTTIKVKLSGNTSVYSGKVLESDDKAVSVGTTVTFKFYSGNVLGISGVSKEVKYSMYCREQCIYGNYPELEQLNKDNGY